MPQLTKHSSTAKEGKGGSKAALKRAKKKAKMAIKASSPSISGLSASNSDTNAINGSSKCSNNQKIVTKKMNLFDSDDEEEFKMKEPMLSSSSRMEDADMIGDGPSAAGLEENDNMSEEDDGEDGEDR